MAKVDIGVDGTFPGSGRNVVRTSTGDLYAVVVDSGGELASLLSQTAQNLRNQEIVEAKIRASVYMYFIFIFTAICFAAPILFGLSSFLVEIITTQIPVLEVPTGIQAPIQISRPEITLSFVIYFVIAVLVTLCIFGSLILGSIKGGSVKSGFKYFPILLISSLGLFFSETWVWH